MIPSLGFGDLVCDAAMGDEVHVACEVEAPNGVVFPSGLKQFASRVVLRERFRALRSQRAWKCVLADGTWQRQSAIYNTTS